MEQLEMEIMNIIVNAGDAKNHAYGALTKANEGDYKGADEEMELANKALSVAHDSQTSFLQREASGEKIDVSILFVHCQDHLMTAISEISLIERIIDLTKKVNDLSKDNK